VKAADVERARVATLEADLRLARQDIDGCVKAFDAMNVPERTPGGDLLRPTGRANELLTRYRRLHALAVEALADLGRAQADLEGSTELLDVHGADYLARLEQLAPEAP
jgi:hypothetical protein